MQPYRLGCPKEGFDGTQGRSEFHRDFDRIIFSTAFRRLYGKTQVVPFPESDLIHTRLTHCLETASVGRSLGNIVKDRSKSSLNKTDYDIGALVSAACLCHDLGNPPLGHSGECAIREFFDEEGSRFLGELTDEQKKDFLNFDGNAMGFRMLTKSNPNKTKNCGGLGITYPVLAAFTKYPTLSYAVDKNCNSLRKKAGIFSESKKDYCEITDTLKIIKSGKNDCWLRHPLAYLVEAADDICNLIIDYEDGYKNGLIDFKEVSESFIKIATSHETGKPKDLIKIISEREKVGYLRAKAIGSLTYNVAEIFIENEELILKGGFCSSLFDKIAEQDTIKNIKNNSVELLYNHRTVLIKEVAGYKIISELLKIFLKAVTSPKTDINRNRKICDLLPTDIEKNYTANPYETMMDILDYVCGMTDNYAVDTYRKLTGVEIPNY